MLEYINMNCPLCNETNMVPIWYGRPTIDEIMLAREDKIVLGGPVTKEFTHYCYSCQETYPFIESSFDD